MPAGRDEGLRKVWELDDESHRKRQNPQAETVGVAQVKDLGMQGSQEYRNISIPCARTSEGGCL